MTSPRSSISSAPELPAMLLDMLDNDSLFGSHGSSDEEETPRKGFSRVSGAVRRLDLVFEPVMDSDDESERLNIIHVSTDIEPGVVNLRTEGNEQPTVPVQEVMQDDHREVVITQEEESGQEDPDTSARSRKRKRNVASWKASIRKRRRAAGESYVARDGKNKSERQIKNGCNESCRRKCSSILDKDDRKIVHKQFWSLSDTKKSHFYTTYVKRVPKKRCRTLNGADSKKKFSFSYFFEVRNVLVQVCKPFFLNTLDISQTRLYYCLDKMTSKETRLPRSPVKGKHGARGTHADKIKEVKEHIESFPKVESHYCRASSKREYLDGRLSIKAMYRLYVDKVGTSAVKEHMYRKVFSENYNLSFHKPKKDRCDFCEEMKIAKHQSDETNNKYEAHLKRKIEGKQERDNDRAMYKPRVEQETAVITFDLQNVFALPKANVSNFFYKRKLNCYNLTAHCSVNGKTYCSLWHECISGRAGNHISSALYKILKVFILDCPYVKNIIIWSDSCVPQNKNSLMTLALKRFMADHDVQVIQQKFSEPGHGNVQEIDAVHSRIERFLKNVEVYSPVSLIRNLLAIPKGNVDLQIIQLHANDFLNFKAATAGMNFSDVPYTKVKLLVYKQEQPMKVEYKLSFTDSSLTSVGLVRVSPRPRGKNVASCQLSGNAAVYNIPRVSALNVSCQISDEKKKDLQSMMRYFPSVDCEFYNALFKK